MLDTAPFRLESIGEIRRVIDRNPWARLAVSGVDGVPVASHLPCLLDDGVTGDDLAILGHVARADPVAERLYAGAAILLIFEGPHGYVSASWYQDGPYVSTWDYVVVHAAGVPAIIDGNEA